jgi:hypothetical protein
MRRSKNLLGFRSFFPSASSVSPPSNSPFRVVGANGSAAQGGGYFGGSSGGIPATAASSTAAMMEHYWNAQNPVLLSGSARVALVALLSLFALGNLYVADQARSEAGTGGVLGSGSASSTHHVRGVTMRESWITPASQPFVSAHRSYTKR